MEEMEKRTVIMDNKYIQDTKKVFLEAVLPIHGIISYNALAALICAPNNVDPNCRISLPTVLATSICAANCVGLYRRLFLRKVPPVQRFFFAFNGSVLHLGASVFTWAVIKRSFNTHTFFALGFSLAACYVYYNLGKKYLDMMDKQFKKRHSKGEVRELQ